MHSLIWGVGGAPAWAHRSSGPLLNELASVGQCGPKGAGTTHGQWESQPTGDGEVINVSKGRGQCHRHITPATPTRTLGRPPPRCGAGTAHSSTRPPLKDWDEEVISLSMTMIFTARPHSPTRSPSKAGPHQGVDPLGCGVGCDKAIRVDHQLPPPQRGPTGGAARVWRDKWGHQAWP